jgi:alanine dehydrogenase
MRDPMKYYFETEKFLDTFKVNRIVEQAFAEHGSGRTQMPSKLYVTFPQGDFRTMPAYLPALNIAGVKIVTVHPKNPALNLPSVMALTLIIDPETGVPLALLNATALTDMRTGAAGAVAAKYLCKKKEIVLGLIGTGRQAESQLEALSEEFSFTEVKIWSMDASLSEAFRRKYPQYNINICNPKKTCECDILVTTTPSRIPIVKNKWIQDGTHINAIGADAPGKQELDPTLLVRGRVFVDDREQAVHSGEINVPVTKGLFSPNQIAGTLGEVVLGKKKRDSAEEVTIFDSTGLAIQDLAIASLALKYGKSIEIPFYA